MLHGNWLFLSGHAQHSKLLSLLSQLAGSVPTRMRTPMQSPLPLLLLLLLPRPLVPTTLLLDRVL
jgi:hypothetical protein